MLSLLLVCLSISLETDKLLDYCNSVLAGILLHFARRLQSVMNAAVIKVRSLYAAPIRQLHWLKVPWRIDYQLTVLVYKKMA